MRKTEHLNHDWNFGVFEKDHLEGKKIDQLSQVQIPHNAIDIPYHHFDEKMTLGLFSYFKSFIAKPEWKSKRVNLIFEAVAHQCTVYLNQKEILTHKGGYIPFEVELKNIIWEQENRIHVVVDTHENPEIPPFGGVVDYLGYGGIYREVRLEITEQAYIKDVFVEQYGLNEATLHCQVSNNIGKIFFEIFDPTQKSVYQESISINESYIRHKIKLESIMKWDINHPYLYQLVTKYACDQEDELTTVFGFRHAEFKKDGFYLNGNPLKIRGLNRHQSYPYVGYAMPKSAQEEDADILKFQLGVNLVRTAHYPQSKHFLNRCDQIGLLVFEEIPGWQHIGNETWKEACLYNTKAMVLRDRNHPSIILWGVRINESADDHDLYRKTNQIARSLDPSRQTGGVRNIQYSEFLEDVYTYNDFSHTGNNKGLDDKKKVTKDVPYLVTEYNGHMFPTKRFDSEKHRVEHALRHLNVLNAMMDPHNGISGSIGWCMSDYNTHQEFGSGDKICHHGVLDMFRIPKYAAYAYMQEGLEEPFMEVTSTMNIGEYPGGNMEEVLVFTNLDSIKLYKNDEYIKTFYPNKTRYPHLKHSPIIIDDFVGERLKNNENMTHKDAEITKQIFKAITKHGNNLSFKYKLAMLKLMKKYKLTRDDGIKLFFKYFGGWGTSKVSFKVEGYRNNQCVKTIHKANNDTFIYVLESNDKPMIMHETYDVKRFVVRRLNQDQELIPFAFDSIKINTKGSIELIGPNEINLIGGAVGFYIKSKEKGHGIVEVMINGQTFKKEVDIL